MNNFENEPYMDFSKNKKKQLKKSLKRYASTLQDGISPIDVVMSDQDWERDDPPDEMRVNLSEGGIHFGKDPFDESCYIGKRQEDDGHILVLGSPGCYKTTGIILPTILTWQGTFVAVDVKGDISEFCRRHQKQIAYPTQIIDFSSNETLHFDPFLKFRKEEAELISNARELAFALVPTPHDMREPFWIQGAQNILTAIILYAVGKRMDFNTMIEMTLTTPVGDIQKAILGSANKAAQSFMIQYPVESSDKMLSGCFVELTNHLHDIFNDNVKNVFSAEDEGFDLECDSLNKNVVIHIPEAKLNQWGVAARLILNQLFSVLSNRLEKHSAKGRCQPPFLLLWDEMPRFGKMENLVHAFETLRSRGVTVCTAIQSFAQLDVIYGPSVRRSLIDCCSYIIIGNVQDVETQKYCAELVGASSIWELSMGENYRPDEDEFSFSRSLNRCREPILYPENFATLSDFMAVTPYGNFRIEKAPVIERNILPMVQKKGEKFYEF